MAFTTVPTVVTGQTWTASNQNQYLKDNMAATAPGQAAAKGDIFRASGVNAVVAVTVGNDGETPIADASEVAGVNWSARPKMPIFFLARDPLVVGNNKGMTLTYHGPTMTFVEWDAVVVTAPTDASLIFDININGTTIWSTQADRPTIVAAANSGSGTDFNTTTLTEGDVLTIDVDQVGSTIPGGQATVTLHGNLTEP